MVNRRKARIGDPAPMPSSQEKPWASCPWVDLSDHLNLVSVDFIGGDGAKGSVGVFVVREHGTAEFALRTDSLDVNWAAALMAAKRQTHTCPVETCRFIAKEAPIVIVHFEQLGRGQGPLPFDEHLFDGPLRLSHLMNVVIAKKADKKCGIREAT